MTYKILLVDDDENVLQGYYRNLHHHFPIEIALGGEQALLALENHGPFAVLVADMRMPGMSGLDLLKEVKERWPDMIRIMLTGNADQRTAVDVVNQGEVFRFLTKPCDAERLRAMIEAGLRQFHLVQAEKFLLGKTLMGSVRVLTELLFLNDPEAFHRSQLVREWAIRLGRQLGNDEWALEAAATLAPIGQKILPPDLLAKLRSGKPLDAQEGADVGRIPERGARLLENIPRMEEVAAIVRYQAKQFDGTGFPLDAIREESIPLGGRILKVAIDFTEMVLARKDPIVVLEELKRRKGWYDPAILATLERILQSATVQVAKRSSERMIVKADLVPGMALTRNLKTRSGQLVLVAGTLLGSTHLEMLKALDDSLDPDEILYVQEEG